MKSLYLPSADSPVIEWLVFALFLVLVCACVGGFVVWLKVLRANRTKRKRRKRKHHRSLNPTLAQTGGLPPKRDPSQAPPGP
jgi:hypothetical protein